jgi:hypothetical protein
MVKINILHVISGSHGGLFQDYNLLECDAMYFGRLINMFRKILLLRYDKTTLLKVDQYVVPKGLYQYTKI